MIDFLVWTLIIAVFLIVVWYLIQLILPSLPPPLPLIVRAIFVVVTGILLIWLLLGLLHVVPVPMRW